MNRFTVKSHNALLLLMALLVAAPNGFSQTPSTVPDLSGDWAWGRCVTGRNCMLIEPTDKRLTERAVAFQKAFDEIAAPKYDCAPMSIPHLYTDPYSFRID